MEQTAEPDSPVDVVHNDSTGLTVWQNAFGLAKIDGITRIQEATRTMTKLHLSWRSVRVAAMDLDLFLTLPDRCRPTLLSSLVTMSSRPSRHRLL